MSTKGLLKNTDCKITLFFNRIERGKQVLPLHFKQFCLFEPKNSVLNPYFFSSSGANPETILALLSLENVVLFIVLLQQLHQQRDI